jgi:hypothetical protein
MTDRELLGLMAAAVWGHIDTHGGTKTVSEIAVEAAREILTDIDETLTADERGGS